MEVWKKVPDFEDYQVSNLGRVKSFKKGKEKLLNPSLNANGYLRLCFSKHNKRFYFSVHQVVSMAFLNHKPNGYELVINHINFIKTDNRLENLEVVTQRENSNKKHLKSSSKYMGVCFSKKNKKWHSYIFFKNKLTHLGFFNSELDASNYYEKALKSIKNGNEIEIKKPNKSSKYKGVYWNKKEKKWQSMITINKKLKHLGWFKNEFDAHLAYENKLKEITL
jgi:hypothetical protein